LALNNTPSLALHLYIDIESLEFPKCVKSEAADDNPVLIVFSDGSKHAYGACAYIRWKTTKDTYESNLIVVKNRIAPTRQLSIPRLELCGAHQDQAHMGM
jgi:hypothetical protein